MLMANGEHTRKHHIGAKRPDETKKAMSRAAKNRQELIRLNETNADLLAALRDLSAAVAEMHRKLPPITYGPISKANGAAFSAIARAEGGK